MESNTERLENDIFRLTSHTQFRYIIRSLIYIRKHLNFRIF
ncbi:hypothetical protein ALT1000_360041 [Alteromonas macleodii]